MRRSARERSSGSATARRSPLSPTHSTSRPVETGATVVPLCGGYWFTGPAREPFRRVADGIGGTAQGLLAPGLVDDPATRQSLYAHAGIRRIIDLWDRLDVAAFGIGGPAWGEAAFGKAVCRQLDDARAVGELLIAPVRHRRALRDAATCGSGRSPSMPAGSIGCPSGSRSPVARPRSDRSSGRSARVRRRCSSPTCGRRRRFSSSIGPGRRRESFEPGRRRGRDPRDRPRDDRGEGRPRHDRRPAARARPGRLPHRHRGGKRAGGAGSRGLVGRPDDGRPPPHRVEPGRYPRGRDRRPRPDARRRRRARPADPAGDHLAGLSGDGRGGRAVARRPGSRAGRSRDSRRPSGSSVTSPRSRGRPAGTSRRGTSSGSG